MRTIIGCIGTIIFFKCMQNYDIGLVLLFTQLGSITTGLGGYLL